MVRRNIWNLLTVFVDKQCLLICANNNYTANQVWQKMAENIDIVLWFANWNNMNACSLWVAGNSISCSAFSPGASVITNSVVCHRSARAQKMPRRKKERDFWSLAI